MVDQVKLNGIVCEKHPQQLCQSFNHSEKASDPLLCLHCLQEQDVPLSQIVMFQTAVNCSKMSYLKNWPPYNLQESEKAILEGSFSGIISSIETQKIQIENMMARMVQDFQISLDKLKKKYFLYLENQQSCAEFIREIYEENSKIEELQQILKDCTSSRNVNQKLKEFISSNRSEFKESKIILQNAIEEFQEQKQLDLTKLMEFTYNLGDSIENFDQDGGNFLKTVSNSQNQQKIAKENEEKIKAQPKKIEEANTQLSQQQQSSIKESQDQHQIKVPSNNANMLESMQNDPLYPDKISLVSQYKLKKDHPPQANVSKFKSLVCNNLCPKKRQPEVELKLLVIEALTKSGISKPKMRPTLFMKSISGGYSYAHLNLKLNSSSKYILRVQFKNVNRLCDSGIGLIQEDLLTAGWGEFKELTFFTHNNTSRTVGKVVQGKNIWVDNYEEALQKFGFMKNTVEIQLCVSQKIFNVIDFPTRQNQLAIFEHAKEAIQDSNNYYVGFYVFGKGDSIKLYDFSEVQEFK